MSDTLKQKLKQNLTEAQKQRDSLRVSVLRMVLADVKNVEIDKKKELSDEDVISVLMSRAKKHKDSIDQFEKAGRNDLVEKEKSELGVIGEFLPEQMSEEELRKTIQEVVVELKSKGDVKIGQVMGALMPKVKGKADGQMVSRLVQEEIAK